MPTFNNFLFDFNKFFVNFKVLYDYYSQSNNNSMPFNI